MKIRSLALELCLLIALGCSHDGVSPGSGPRIEILSGASATDTIDTQLPHPLIVLVRDSSGQPAPVGTLVRFSSVVHAGQTSLPPYETPYEAYVEALDTQELAIFATGTTDAAGRTGVLIRFGEVAGTAHIVVEAPLLGLIDTVTYTVTPGAAAGIAMMPADTTVAQGGSYQLQGGVVDRYGNPRPDSVTWSSTSSGIQVTAGGTLTATTVGRYTLSVQRGALHATGLVSVVPHGRLIAASGTNVLLFNLDGSHLDTVSTNVSPAPGDQAQWIPGTNRMVYQVNAAVIGLYTVDTTGAETTFPTAPPSTMGYASEPAPSANGQWVYFGAIDSRCSLSVSCLYRAKADGSNAELLGMYQQQNGTLFSPAPSPDGGKVAFVTDSSGYSVIRILDVSTRTLEPSFTRGVDPAWSPNGQQIAYQSSTDGTLYIMNADATNARQLNATTYPRHAIVWSPDSQWLLLRSDSVAAYVMVNAQSGQTLPLRYTNPYWSPTWVQ